jgi:hypothetical protein
MIVILFKTPNPFFDTPLSQKGFCARIGLKNIRVMFSMTIPALCKGSSKLREPCGLKHWTKKFPEIIAKRIDERSLRKDCLEEKLSKD